MASRAAVYCRGEKISVTLRVTPAAHSSSTQPRPAGVAGTLIMRFLMRSDTMMGFEVAPVAPRARLLLTRSGSMESSHSLVPVATRDFRALTGEPPARGTGDGGCFTEDYSRAGADLRAACGNGHF